VVRTTFSSREVIKTLTKHGYVPVGGKGSHTTLRYENEDTGEVRTVTVPQADPIPIGTLQDIAEQAGGTTFMSSVSGSIGQANTCRQQKDLNQVSVMGAAGLSHWA